MVFHVNSDGKYFITHPWKLLEIASWDIAKFVVAPFCLVGLVFQMWTFSNQTQGLQQDQGNLKPDEKMVKNPPKKKKNKKSSSKKKEGNLQYQHVGETEIEADQENDIDIRYGDQSIFEPQPQSHQPTENLELELKSIVRDKSSINNLTKLLAVGADGIEVFEDTRDQRLVAVKRIIYSDEALAIAYNERQNHYNTENHSNQILRHYGLDFTDSYIYVYLQPWMCTIVSGVAELHRSNIIHRDINLESFFIMATEDEDFIAKLGDLSMGKLLGDSGYFGEQKRKAPEQIQRKNQFEGLTNDVYFLGCVFGFSISQGNHVFEDVHFYSVASRCFVGSKEKDVWNSLQKSAGIVLENDKCWDTRLEDAFRIKIAKEGYSCDRLADLVRLVRNTLWHYGGEENEDVEHIVGTSQESILEYFDRKFPQLLVQVYYIAFDHYRTHKDLRTYFEHSITRLWEMTHDICHLASPLLD
ncbi:hypothetical protein HID58_037025 [Brassica napus]|uniref:Protein kinase domain-containing protein n=1 Tax=Brassica napus TaxID=3708 RepID=A0ABQ8C9G4_BRANA|nr:hypothetical protein HID58_037025 [Brassica napus]